VRSGPLTGCCAICTESAIWRPAMSSSATTWPGDPASRAFSAPSTPYWPVPSTFTYPISCAARVEPGAAPAVGYTRRVSGRSPTPGSASLRTVSEMTGSTRRCSQTQALPPDSFARTSALGRPNRPARMVASPAGSRTWGGGRRRTRTGCARDGERTGRAKLQLIRGLSDDRGGSPSQPDLEHELLLIRAQRGDLRLEVVDLVADGRDMARLRQVEERQSRRGRNAGQKAGDARLSRPTPRSRVALRRALRGA